MSGKLWDTDNQTATKFQAIDEPPLNGFFTEYFAITKPMSKEGNGDGIWYHINGDCIYLIIYDCSGKGKIAKMTTRIYRQAFTKVVVDMGIEYTGSILQYVHRELLSKFADKSETQFSTGAEVAVIKVGKSESVIEYAGAKLDLWELSNGEIDIHKSDRMPIGEMFDFRHQYNSNTLTKEDGSIYYITTDGFKTLLGGPHIRKLGKAGLNELLKSFGDLPLPQQADRIINHLKKWMGQNPQLDDLLMVGFKL